MISTTLLRSGSLRVIDRRCDALPSDAPFVEVHGDYSLSYVRRGTFGYRSRGASFELVAGSILVGYPCDEYVCTHDHARGDGDECLSFHMTPTLVEAISDRPEVWQRGCVPPLPELMVLGELAQAAAEGRTDVGLDEIGMALASRFVDIAAGRSTARSEAHARPRPCGGSGPLARCARDRGHRPHECGTSGRVEPISFPAGLRECARRDAPSVSGPRPATSRGPAAGRRQPVDHRRRVRRGLRRSLQLRAHVPSRHRRLPRKLPPGGQGGPQDSPREADRTLPRMTS